MDVHRRRVIWAAVVPVLLLLPAAAAATPLEYIPVGDPLEDEIRTLDVLGPLPGGRPLRLVRTGMRPLQRFELDSLPSATLAPGRAHYISLMRLERTLARDRDGAVIPPGGTPRLYQKHYGDGSRFELSVGAEGVVDWVTGSQVRYASDTGIHGRVALETARWLAFSHVVVGHQDSARSFADPVFQGTDVVAHTSETYIAYTGTNQLWALQFGRNRWAWGPGLEGSMLLSKTAPPITGLAFRARIEALRLDAMAISGTLRSTAGDQLAAHRLEWQVRDNLRLGLSEAAIYRSEAWQPLYLLGAIPYILVQRMMDQDEPEAKATHRNNIMVGGDVAWRIAPGTRVYAELLADDLQFTGSGYPNRFAMQVGWDGAATFRGTRLVWNGEYTRVNRYVYTSSFGRDFTSQGQSLGFPVSPDSRRMRVRGAWDFTPSWQLLAMATFTKKGENTLADPYIPGLSPASGGTLEGVVEEARELELGARWWPSVAVDLTGTLAFLHAANANHVIDATSNDVRATLAFRLLR